MGSVDELLKFAGLETINGRFQCWELAQKLTQKIGHSFQVQIRVSEISNFVPNSALKGVRISSLEGEPLTPWIPVNPELLQTYQAEANRLLSSVQ